MKKVIIPILFICSIILFGCTENQFTPINHHQSFVASVNILEPSVSFYDSKGNEITNWSFKKEYTGGTLIENDQLLLYGHQLTEADIYQLSTGKLLTSIKTGIGTTNAFYDSESKKIFLSNSDTNSIASFNDKWELIKECQVKNYPMSMTAYNGELYVINYKDTVLSVVNIETMEVKEEWEIEKSSNGLIIIPEKDTLWIGGHGEGSKPNQTVDIYDLNSGKLLKKKENSMMPINFARKNNEIYIINHGSNELFATDLEGTQLWRLEVGANPFSVSSFQKNVVVAGYDDDKLYFINDGVVIKTVNTKRGPFQLLVREVQ